jgi:small-conductance mechanosensitive channel
MQAILRSLTASPRIWIEPAIVFAATALAALVARQLLLRSVRLWTRRTNSRPGLIVGDALRAPTTIWSVILAVHFAIQSSAAPEQAAKIAPKLLAALWIVSFTLMCARLARDLVRYYGEKVTSALPVTSLTQNVAQISVMILGLLPLLKLFGVEITPMLTALGVGGLAVALALQDTLSNLFAGVHVAVAGNVRLGDYIKLNTGEEGYVSDIGWRSATLRSQSNNLIVVPNAKLAQAIVTNYHLPEKWLSASLKVAVGHDADPDRVERILLGAATEGIGQIAGLRAEPAPSAAFDPGLGEYALEFTLYFCVDDFASQSPVRNALRKRILRKLREEGIEIPFPSRAVYLSGAPPQRPEAK